MGVTEKIDLTKTYVQTAFRTLVGAVSYKNIFNGTANSEMGFDPSTGDEVYFINTRNNVVFFMYDDRGCLLFSRDQETLEPIYRKYNSWLVDYWRKVFDGLFK